MKLRYAASAPYCLLSLFMASQALLTVTLSLTLRNEFKTSCYDGILFAQILHNIISGSGLISTLAPPFVSMNFLGVHFCPILYALAPVYYVLPYVETLLAVQSLLVALAAWPIFLTANHILQSRWQALIVSVFYLINPFVIYGAGWDFHEIAFAPLLIAFILWAIVCKKRTHLLVFCALLLLVKEHYGIAVFGSGILWAWRWSDWRFGSALALLGLIAFAVILLVIMPHYDLSHSLIWANAQSTNTLNRFSWLSDPFGQIERLESIAISGIFYIISMLMGLWFLPLGAPMWLLPGAADFAVNALSTNPMMRSPFSYHSIALQPVILIAGVMCIAKRFSIKDKLKPGDVLIAVAILSLTVSYLYTTQTNIWELSSPRITLLPEDDEAIGDINQLIPQNAMVAGQQNTVPQISPRKGMSLFPDHLENASYIVLYAQFPFRHSIDVFAAPYGVDGDYYFDAVRKLFADRQWGIIYYENSWLVLQKGAKDDMPARMHAMEKFDQTQHSYDEMVSALKAN